MIDPTRAKRYPHHIAMMHGVVGIIFATLIASCTRKTLPLDPDQVARIEIYGDCPGTPIPIKEGLEKALIADLSQSIDVGPMKYWKTHSFLVYYTTSARDTIYTNGKLHQFHGWYESKEDLIKKYAVLD